MTISSVLGRLGAANLSAYTASKAALLAYNASLSAELSRAAPQVKTIVVTPGQMDTDLFRDISVRGWLQRFVGPVVGAREVALRIVEMLDRGVGGEISLPFYAGLIPWLDVLPVSIGRGLRKWSGLDDVVKVQEGLLETLDAAAQGKESPGEEDEDETSDSLSDDSE